MQAGRTQIAIAVAASALVGAGLGAFIMSSLFIKASRPKPPAEIVAGPGPVQFSTFGMTMFRAAFDANDAEQLRLVDYLRWLKQDNAAQKLLKSPLGPSELWKRWARETYVGFSTDRVMLQSGHHFGPAEQVPSPTTRPWRSADYDPRKDARLFSAAFPSYKVPDQHAALIAAHPGAYWRSAEAFLLSGRPNANRMLEIGAGNAVHVAYRHMLKPDMQTVIMDLPETIPAGFLLMRVMGIDVALPNEAPRQVTMRLPYQDIDGDFDFAFSMAVLQEMTPATINAYLKFIAERLRPEGREQHVTLEQSRYIPDNNVHSYDYAGLQPIFVPALFQQSIGPFSEKEKVFSVTVKKSLN